jgi:hypothetical protein
MIFRALLIFLLVSLVVPSAAQPGAGWRVWRSADSPRTLEGQVVGLAGEDVTLRLRDGRRITFPLERLVPDDRAEARRQAGGSLPQPAVAPADAAALRAFAGLALGNSYEATAAALMGLPGVKAGLAGTLQGRTGLNGIYSIDLAGARWAYFLGWDAAERLAEASLHGPEDPPGDYETKTHALWEKARALMVASHGEPMHSPGFAELERIAEGRSEFSDVWQIGEEYLYLGTGRLDGRLCCVLRRTAQAPPRASPPP